MHVLILEEEPIIAIDLEDIVVTSRENATCILANTVEAGLASVRDGVDFALIDVHVGDDRKSSLLVAEALWRRKVPFCFVSSSRAVLPESLREVPFIAKPFRAGDVVNVLP